MQTTSVMTPDKNPALNLSGSVAANRAISPNSPIESTTQVEQVKSAQATQEAKATQTTQVNERQNAESQKEGSSGKNSQIIVSEQALESKLDAHVEYEGETQGHRGAISQYLQTQHAAKREEIQQMVGVDIYA